MFDSHLTRQCEEGEEVLALVRSSVSAYLGSAIVAAAFLFGPFFFLFPLLRLRGAGALLFAALLVTGVFLAVRFLMVLSLNALIVTKRRLIDVEQRGMFHRVVSECPYGKVQEVTVVKRGIVPTLFGFGDVRIEVVGDQANILARAVKNPDRVRDLVSRLREEAGGASDDEEDDEEMEERTIATLRKLKRSVGAEALKRMLDDDAA